MFSRSEFKLVYWLQRTIGHEVRKIRQGKQIVVSRRRATFARRHSSFGVFEWRGRGAGQRTHDERSHRIIARGVGEQGGIGVSQHAVLADHECRPEISDVGILDHRHAAVVERQPAPVQPRGSHRMILAMDGIAQHHDPDIIRREAGAAQGCEFRNRIILAVATATRERCERRRPDVDLAVLGEVADRPDGEIDGAVDFAEPGAALARPGSIDDVEEFQRGR